MKETTVKYGNIVIHLYLNYKNEPEVNIGTKDGFDNVTLSIPETRCLAIALLGMRSELFDNEELEHVLE